MKGCYDKYELYCFLYYNHISASKMEMTLKWVKEMWKETYYWGPTLIS